MDAEANGGASTSHGHPHPLWSKVWKLQVLPKVRIFLWRALLDILPTGRSLHSRIQLTSPICHLCGDGTESLRHCLFECGWLIDLRRICPQYNRWCSTPTRSFEALVETVFDRETTKDKCLFATLLWAIWKNRCTGVFEGKKRPLVDIYGDAVNLISRASDDTAVDRSDQHVSSFVAPSRSYIAVHVDAASDQDGRTGGGAICRNWRGEPLLAGTFSFCVGIEVELAELLAIREGLKLALRFNGTQATIWSDSLLNIERLNKGCPELHWLKPLVDECLRLAEQIPDCNFKFTRRDGNLPAHMIEKLGLRSPLGIVGKSNLPQSIVSVMTADIAE